MAVIASLRCCYLLAVVCIISTVTVISFLVIRYSCRITIWIIIAVVLITVVVFTTFII